MLIKKSIILIGLSACIGVQAGVYQCPKADLRLPCITDVWEFGGDALYFAQTGALLPNIIATGNQVWNMGYDWGFRIEAGRHFGKGQDFNINWAYFNQSQNFIDNATAPGGGGIFAAANTPFTYSNYMSVVNVELGQTVELMERWMVRAHLGLQIDKLEAKMESPAAGVTSTGQDNMVGPRIGLNLAYKLWEGLSVYTNGALGALYGSSRYVSPDLGAFANRGLNSDFSINNGVTVVDYAIGLKYNHMTEQGDITGRVGWSSYNFDHTQVNGTWQGLLFGLKWMGAA